MVLWEANWPSAMQKEIKRLTWHGRNPRGEKPTPGGFGSLEGNTDQRQGRSVVSGDGSAHHHTPCREENSQDTRLQQNQHKPSQRRLPQHSGPHRRGLSARLSARLNAGPRQPGTHRRSSEGPVPGAGVEPDSEHCCRPAAGARGSKQICGGNDEKILPYFSFWQNAETGLLLNNSSKGSLLFGKKVLR